MREQEPQEPPRPGGNRAPRKIAYNAASCAFIRKLAAFLLCAQVYPTSENIDAFQRWIYFIDNMSYVKLSKIGCGVLRLRIALASSEVVVADQVKTGHTFHVATFYVMECP